MRTVDSSLYKNNKDFSLANAVDTQIRLGIVKEAFNDSESGELLYQVEVQSNGTRINTACRQMVRLGGIFNYEDMALRSYTPGIPQDSTTGYETKAGDIVLVAHINGQYRTGIIIGSVTHPGRTTAIKAKDGPQYDAEFNGIHTNINAAGEWTLTFKGQPTNLSLLKSAPMAPLPAPTYNTAVGTSFMKFNKLGGWTVSDNAHSNPQSIVIDKANGTVTTTSGQVSLKLDKNAQSTTLTTKDTTVNSSNSITEKTSTYSLTASTSAKINSPKVAIGHDSIELLEQLNQLIIALGQVIPISPVGPCTPLMATGQWPQVQQVQQKINTIKGSL